jgi:hypothetical protein
MVRHRPPQPARPRLPASPHSAISSRIPSSALSGSPSSCRWLLFVVTLLDSPFKSARSAMIPDILAGENYVLGTAVTQTTLQVGMISGYALGGLVVAFLGVRAALLIDAATFAAGPFGTAPPTSWRPTRLCGRCAADAPRPGLWPGQRRHAGNTGPVDRPCRRGGVFARDHACRCNRHQRRLRRGPSRRPGDKPPPRSRPVSELVGHLHDHIA